eukprot:m.170463 g.170463  ORF g.170463 m.170463 type:complete len:63 (+) comp39042_c3_seq7:78-266(+)
MFQKLGGSCLGISLAASCLVTALAADIWLISILSVIQLFACHAQSGWNWRGQLWHHCPDNHR